MTRIYLAGPMSGYPDHNYPAFHRTAGRLRNIGYDTVSPAELHEPGLHPWDWYLRADLVELVGCDELALLHGWLDSRGARLEWHVATELGMPVSHVRELCDSEGAS